MRKLTFLPCFLNTERTPLVDQLLDIVKEREDYIRELEEEINRLKRLPRKPAFEDKKKTSQDQKIRPNKRPGSDKVKKTAELPVHHVEVVKVTDKPDNAVFKGYRNFIVQDISIQLNNRLFKCERWQRIDGSYIQASLPHIYKSQHFGPHLRSYVLHQVYHQGVTRNLLLGQLREWGIDISKGQLNNLLIQNKDPFHSEKMSVLEAGCFNSTYLQADDTGARHQGKTGYCTYIGNEHFAFYESSFVKNRLNYLTCLAQALPKMMGYALDHVALQYLKSIHAVSPRLMTMLESVKNAPEFFCDEMALERYLKRLGMISPRDLRLCKEAALFSPLKRFLFKHHEVLFITDEAGQFRLPTMKHALCWLHVARKLKQLLPHTPEQRECIAKKEEQLWHLYSELNAYKLQPSQDKKHLLRQQFAELCAPVANEKSLNEVLDRIKRWEERLLLVLDYPFVPLHNNTSERDIREMVRRRKVSGGTRHDDGRQCRDTFASLKKTCQKVGITFWDYLNDRTVERNQNKPMADYFRMKALKKRAAETRPF